MTVIFHIFLFCNLFLTSGGIYFCMCEACLDLPHCVAEALPCSMLLLPGHESLVYSVLVSPFSLSFRATRYLSQVYLRFRASSFNPVVPAIVIGEVVFDFYNRGVKGVVDAEPSFRSSNVPSPDSC